MTAKEFKQKYGHPDYQDDIVVYVIDPCFGSWYYVKDNERIPPDRTPVLRLKKYGKPSGAYD